jgi:hypothetical protein
MSADPSAPTVGFVLPWVNAVLDGTERVTGLIPEDKLDWRLPDPSGRWHFSLAEIAMHCADSRVMFARQLAGNDSQEGYWSIGYPGDDGIWQFHPYGSKQAILDSLKRGRAELQPFFDLPAASCSDVTAGMRKIYDKYLAGLREKGKETDAATAELRGPANIVRVLMAVVAHENGHKSSLCTLLRMHGVDIREGN